MATQDESDSPKFNGYYGYVYETSSVFATLKGNTEKIKGNYSTEQYLNALDELLFRAVEPILRCCTFVDGRLAGLLSWYASASRPASLCRQDRETTVLLITSFLVSDSATNKMRLLKELHFDRHILIALADDFLASTTNYRQRCEEATARRSKALLANVLAQHADLGHDPLRHDSVYAAIAQVEYWLRQALTLRTQILEKYYRSILNDAKRIYEEMSYSIHLNDVIQAMLVLACRAIDKCDQQRGVLTTYLKRWTSGVRSKTSLFEKDTAFSTPVGRKAEMLHKAIPLESLEDDLQHQYTDDTEATDEILTIRKIARIADPTGLARMTLNIEEYVPALKV